MKTFTNIQSSVSNCLHVISLIIVRNKKNNTTGIITDGNIRKTGQNNSDIHKLSVKKVMTKNPITVDINMLAAKALGIMNEKKITSLLVCSGQKSKKKNA